MRCFIPYLYIFRPLTFMKWSVTVLICTRIQMAPKHSPRERAKIYTWATPNFKAVSTFFISYQSLFFDLCCYFWFFVICCHSVFIKDPPPYFLFLKGMKKRRTSTAWYGRSVRWLSSRTTCTATCTFIYLFFVWFVLFVLFGRKGAFSHWLIWLDYCLSDWQSVCLTGWLTHSPLTDSLTM